MFENSDWDLEFWSLGFSFLGFGMRFGVWNYGFWKFVDWELEFEILSLDSESSVWGLEFLILGF